MPAVYPDRIKGKTAKRWAVEIVTLPNGPAIYQADRRTGRIDRLAVFAFPAALRKNRPAMALAQLHWFSSVLGKQVAANVLLPNTGRGPFAVMYLLHGLSDDHTIWLRRTRIESYIENLPLIVVMPDGFRGFYTDNEAGPAYGKYIGQELPDCIERLFPAKRTRAGRCLTGLSMGGYGAIRLALAHPDRFASAVSHSGALMFGTVPEARLEGDEFNRIRGKSPAGGAHDLQYLLKAAKKARALPRIRFDCGTDDFLLSANRAFSAFLTRQKVAHEYAEYPGGHNWDYWDLHVREALAFHGYAGK